MQVPRAARRVALVIGLCLALPACAEGMMMLAWLASTLVMGSILYLGRQLFALDWLHDRQRVLGETAALLGLPAPGQAELTWRTATGQTVRAHATPALELRMDLPGWVPDSLVVDTIAPPMRGLRHLVPDPRFLEWVAAGDPAELLGALAPEVREALLEAHYYGPAPGICIRRRNLEVALPARDLDLLDVTVERMERIALCLAALPTSLPERLLASVRSEDQPEVRRASLRTLQERFPEHRATLAAVEHAMRTGLLPRVLPAPERESRRGWLTISNRGRGALALRDDDEAA